MITRAAIAAKIEADGVPFNLLNIGLLSAGTDSLAFLLSFVSPFFPSYHHHHHHHLPLCLRVLLSKREISVHRGTEHASGNVTDGCYQVTMPLLWHIRFG